MEKKGLQSFLLVMLQTFWDLDTTGTPSIGPNNTGASVILQSKSVADCKLIDNGNECVSLLLRRYSEYFFLVLSIYTDV